MAENGDTQKVSALDGQAPEGTDFANYFCTYAYLYHQKDMLQDHTRTGAYFNACMQNKRCFRDKVVLDVGTGSGILAIFAAKAGARKVYAVEATDMAKSARKLVAANKLEDVVEVIQGTIETIELPEKVDIIISEWMGYFLLRESMLDSVLLARDKYLAPGGALYPSHARLFLAPIRTHVADLRVNEFQGGMEDWAGFLQQMKTYYQVDLDALSDTYRTEQLQYYLGTSQWCDIHPSQLLGPGAVFKSFDLNKVTIEELKAPLKASCKLVMAEDGPVDALCGWFDVTFAGSDAHPADSPVVLSTGPDARGSTHWGQQVFYCRPGLEVDIDDTLQCQVVMTRRTDNHRLLKVEYNLAVEPNSSSSAEQKEPQQPRPPKWSLTYNID